MALRRLATSYPWNSDVPSCARSAAAWQIASSRGTSDPGFRRMTVSIRSYLFTDKRPAGARVSRLTLSIYLFITPSAEEPAEESEMLDTHRRRSTTLLVLGMVVVGAAARGQRNPDIDVTGTWALEISMPSGPSVSMVTLTQSGNSLTGDYSSRLLGDHKVEGRITGEKIEISFKFARTRGGPENVTVLLNGTIAGTNAFAGDIKLTPGNAGTFAAKREAAVTAAGSPVAQRPPAAPEWRDPSPHRATMVNVDGEVTIEVLDWGGTGQPLVLLAGQGNTAHVFDDFALRLMSCGHVYGITRRGYGKSSVPRQGYDADRLADDVLSAVDALRLERPILIGHSVAGDELSSFAARFPSRAGALV